jgi:uroporphyrinogen decarboxylase
MSKMTSRERLLTVIRGKIPDHVPVAPDTSNMIPARMTGKPFWDLYLYQDPPIWKAYIDCVKYFGFDSLMDGYVQILFDDLGEIDREWTEAIVFQNNDRIVTQLFRKAGAKIEWQPQTIVYYRDNPPTYGVLPEAIKLPKIPDKYTPVEKRREWPGGEELLKLVKEEMGDHGLVGVFCGGSQLLANVQDIFDYADNPERFHGRRDELLIKYEKRFHKLMSLECKPDFICTGGSGSLVFQSPAIFRELALPIVKKVTALCKEAGIPSHIHSCGPETELVKIAAEETDLSIIDPLEIPPMGDCNLAELKKLYGHKLVLKGNLHTTEVMLRGSADDVRRASMQAIDDAAEGGRFILSSGDQCGRDTPDENIFAMIETAKTYGRYPLQREPM